MLYETSSDSAGQRQAVCILKIFIGTVKPLLEDLGQWLEDAALPAAHDDFFIRKGKFLCDI